MAKLGRPSTYKPEYATQAKKLCLLGATDGQIAKFFGVDLGELAEWAFYNEEFFNAITPTPDEINAYAEDKERRSQKRRQRRSSYMARNPSARIRASMSARMWSALKGKKDESLFDILSYSFDALKRHIESMFYEGMSWENYGKWHVDHVKPCAAFDLTDKDQFDTCWSLSNLQPLWASDNIKKGAKYVGS